MTTITRNGVFETNSSSTHSISVSNENINYNVVSLDKGILYCQPDDFGRYYESFSDFGTKLSYLITAVKDMNDVSKDEAIENITYVLKKCINGFESLYIENIDGGYIDHQSYGVASEVLFDKITLEHYLFSPNSVLIIDSDG